MANNVRVTELDFDQIKTNLKNYLRSQSQFTDYDFDASNLSVLLDILAYNTHYNAVLANMVSNEMFLDTALKRSSVVSLAKHLSYVPDSKRAAAATVTVQLQNVPGEPNFVTLNRFTLFSTNIDGSTYNFYNTESQTAEIAAGVYTFNNVRLYQGRILEYFFTVGADPTPANKYIIPNADIDINTLEVSVQYAGVGSFSEPWSRVTDITEVNGTSKVYFIQENTQGLYEIYFGDDIIGAALDQNDVIQVRYLISDGVDANVSTNVNLTWSTNTIAGEGSGDRTFTTISKPTGGRDKEDLETIRFRSINNYTAQNRTVTKTDYANLISSYIPGAESINVWGGEQNVPPEYGKTFISIKPRTGYVLTDLEKEYIVNDVLQSRSMVTAQHEFVDPIYTYLTFKIDVRFSSARTNRTAGDIKSLVNSKVSEFMSANLNKFNANFYRSQLEEQIMDLDDSILSVNVLFDLLKTITLEPYVRFAGGTTTWPSKLHPNEVRSSYYYFEDLDGIIHPAQVRDIPDQSPPDYEGTGTLKAFDLDTGSILEGDVGTVNYGTGSIVWNSAARLELSGYIGGVNQFYLYAGIQESVGDLFPGFNEILSQDTSTAVPLANVSAGITINVTAANS